MSEQPPEPEGLTDEVITPDEASGMQADPDERTDPDLVNGVPGDDAARDPNTRGGTE